MRIAMCRQAEPLLLTLVGFVGTLHTASPATVDPETTALLALNPGGAPGVYFLLLAIGSI
ncbi:hypothetical protein D9M68_682230 [compost metagenome]